MTRLLVPLALALLADCSSGTRVVRLETGQGEPTVFTPRPREAVPVTLKDAELKEAVAKLAQNVLPPARPQEAARQLFEMDARSGSYLYDVRSRRLAPLGPGEHLEVEPSAADVELTREYLRWCESNHTPGDCRRLLVESPTLNGDGRYALAMALAKDVVLDEMMDAFKGMADPQAMVAAVLWTWTTYMILIAVPEPVSKGIAAAITVAVISYIGVDTFWSLIQGFKQLVKAADQATTFAKLREAGERYGKVMGRNAARAFAMLATAAIGSTAAGLATKVPTLPGATQAAAQARTQLGVHLAGVGSVTMVAVSAEVVTLSLAPAAVAMASQGTSAGASTNAAPAGSRAWGSFSGFKKAMGPAGKGKEWHHIVEQTPGNVKRFGPEALHNTENVIPLDSAIHTRISSIYSSIRESITSSDRLTVRQWLSTQSFKAQREFGLLAIENVRKGIW